MQSIARIIDKVKSKQDDDFIDRANYVYTALMFGTFGLITAAKQYVGEPLQCWIPADFKGAWEKYSENYCFVENTYYVSVHGSFPKPEEREKTELQYYQWVCFMMMAQMIFFILPKTLWNALHMKTGLAIQSLVSTSKLTMKKGSNALLKDDPQKDIVKAKQYMQTMHKFNKEKAKNQARGPLKPSFWTGYITKLYLLFKIVNLCNSVIQLYLLNQFLGPKYTFWGYGLLADLLQGRQWQESGHFPRVTYCDVKVRMPPGKKINTFTIQCVLMINMFNEKIYIFIWFWLLFLSVANLLNLIQWLYLTMSEKRVVQFIRTQLAYKNHNLSYAETKEFMEGTLFLDAVTTLRLVQLNCGDLVSSDLVHHLYLDYVESRKEIISPLDESLEKAVINDYI